MWFPSIQHIFPIFMCQFSLIWTLSVLQRCSAYRCLWVDLPLRQPFMQHIVFSFRLCAMSLRWYFCRFRALAYTTLDKLWIVFVYIVFYRYFIKFILKISGHSFKQYGLCTGIIVVMTFCAGMTSAHRPA